MSDANGYYRRNVVRSLGVVGVVGLAGCNGDEGGDEDTPTDTPEATPTPTPTPEDTPTPTPEETPDDEGESDGEDEQPDVESVEGAVAGVNETIDSLNEGEASIASVNEGLENVEDIDLIESVSAETEAEAGEEASRLREEADRVVADIVDRIPREIEEQASFLIDADEVNSVQDMRDEAEDIGSEDAAQALRDGADLADHIEESLQDAADRLEAAEG